MFKYLNFTQRDKYLLIGCIACCMTLAWLAWELNVPVEQARTTQGWISTFTVNGNDCYYGGVKFKARSGICYSEDIPD